MPVTPGRRRPLVRVHHRHRVGWRVGTSIWLMLNRTSSTTTASVNVGMNGTSISSTFDGRCVNTIVLTSPNRAASGPAASADRPARMLAPNSMPPSTAGSTPNRWWNQ